jgi:hypothetical protein
MNTGGAHAEQMHLPPPFLALQPWLGKAYCCPSDDVTGVLALDG